ncbi:MAG: DNA polymerase Y family protein, partial [Myxococcaceae bacterium]|nr:DNA polymerase Y family protein [Myxococcaceae bacterium]
MRLGYLALPRFPVQRRVREQPQLKGRALVLAREHQGVRWVEHASGAALAAAIRPGMTVARASSRLPGLLTLPYSPADEAQAVLALGEALLTLAPGFQLDAPRGLWLDASAAALKGGERPWLQAVVEACAALGRQGQAAVASERFTAQVAAGRSALEVVAPGGGAAALAFTPLEALSLTGRVDAVQVGALRSLGLATLGELAALPSGAVAARYGAAGVEAARLARGDDEVGFTPDALPEVIDEALAFDWPAQQLEPVLFGLKTVVDRLASRLQGRGQAAVRLTAWLVLEQGTGPVELPLRLARPSAQGKLLLELLRHQLGDLVVRSPVTGLRLRVDEACADEARQLRLDEAPAGEAALEVVLSRLSSALGPQALQAAELQAQLRADGAFRLKPFSPPRPGHAPAQAGADPVHLARPARLLRAP